MSWKTHQRPGKTAYRSARFRPLVEQLETREVPSSTSTLRYVVPTAAGVTVTPILTVGDSVPRTGGGSFRMVGIADGLGAFDNGDGTFTVLMNHELRDTSGVIRSHGSAGAFVSKFIIDKSTLEVLTGEDLIRIVQLWNGSGYTAGTTAFSRFCSADLPAVTALYNPASGLGTQARIYLNGEEVRTGRAFAHVVTGPDAGISYQLPWLGQYAFENVVASPFAQDKTIVIGLDDSDRRFSSEGSTEPSELYIYIGLKQNTGSEVERAGLTGGNLFGLKVTGAANENQFVSGAGFTLHGFGDVSNQTAAGLQTDSISNGVTQFRRIEDGAWDPNNSNDFYFVTTDQFGGQSKLWRLRFEDITNPTLGGKIELLIDGAGPGEMFDNIAFDSMGRVLLQEDPGNQAYLAKLWIYDTTSGALLELARHNPQFFQAGSPDFITQDEESSGIIDVSHIFGDGHYLFDVQVHKNISATEPELVEMGQLLLMHVGAAAGLGFDGASGDPALVALGTQKNDHIQITQTGSDFTVRVGAETLGQFTGAVDQVFAVGYGGNDHVDLSAVQADALVYGGAGNDFLTGGSGLDYLSGGTGNDQLDGNEGADRMEGGAGNDRFLVDLDDILVDFGFGNDSKKMK